jgi:hypothetical protein
MLYVYFLSVPKNRTVTIPDCNLDKEAKGTLVSRKGEAIRLVQKQGGVQFQLPENLVSPFPFLVKISGLKD